jgi:hypothetical protein
MNNIYSICNGIWDINNNNIKKATTSDIMECCIKYCNKTDKFCNKQCDTNKQKNDCNTNCKLMKDACLNSCMRISPDYWGHNTNPYLQCANDNGCKITSNYVSTDQQCINNNKPKILECCVKNCKDNNKSNCIKYCNTTHNLVGEYTGITESYESTNKPSYTNIVIKILMVFIILYLIFYHRKI